MAARDPAYGQPRAAQRPVGLDRLHGIRRACRRVPARRWRPRRYQELIAPYDPDQDSSEHRPSTASLTSRARLSKSAPYARPRARMSTSARRPCESRPGRICRRPISRSRRFNRFRSTILRPCFGTMRPSRDLDPGAPATNTSRLGVVFRFPASSNRRISALLAMRAAAGSSSGLTRSGPATCRRPAR